jgi:sialate O-acetylesterase
MVSQTPAEDLEQGEWKVCTPESISEFSAVGYFFGRNLFQNLNVPIGLIHSAWGGTVAESWTSARTIENDPDFKDKLKELAGLDESKCRALKTPAVNPNDYPTLLFNGMVNPVIPFGIRGVIWYQGESNVNFAKQYQRVFPAMIVDWRKHWKQGDFSFLFVSLANHKEPDKQPTESRWAELREAQTKTQALPKTGMALAIDLGDTYDIHPKNKQDVGQRLALSALKTTYDKNLVHAGPMFQTVRFDSIKAVVTFGDAGSGLVTKNKYGYVNCFAIAGANKKFVWAQARITGKNSLEVYADTVKNPVAVRFAWSDNPADFNLYNQEGFPANPFRTDDWPGITK